MILVLVRLIMRFYISNLFTNHNLLRFRHMARGKSKEGKHVRAYHTGLLSKIGK